MCAPTPVHEPLQAHCIGFRLVLNAQSIAKDRVEDCVHDRFQLPNHVGSRTQSSGGSLDEIEA